MTGLKWDKYNIAGIRGEINLQAGRTGDRIAACPERSVACPEIRHIVPVTTKAKMDEEVLMYFDAHFYVHIQLWITDPPVTTSAEDHYANDSIVTP